MKRFFNGFTVMLVPVSILILILVLASGVGAENQSSTEVVSPGASPQAQSQNSSPQDPPLSILGNSPAGQQNDVAEGVVLVKFSSLGRSPEMQALLASTYGFSDVLDIPAIGVKKITAPRGMEKAFAANLSANPLVEYAEPDYILYTANIPNDPLYPPDPNTSYLGQWNLERIGAPQAWDVTTGDIAGSSDKITIAILDTGVDYTHTDLNDKIVDGYDFGYKDDDPMPENDGHGTGVAGVASAETNNALGVAGVSWGAQIMPVKVEGPLFGIQQSYVTEGIVFAVDNGANVINMSIGSFNYSQAQQDALDYAYANNVVAVAAAGNEAQNGNRPIYPANNDHVVSVAATDQDNNRASFSSYNDHVDIAAPGVVLKTTSCCNMNSDGTGYSSFAGTSGASPQVAGLAALVLAVNPSLTPGEVARIIEKTATDLGPAGRDDYFGYGLINAAAAVSAATEAQPSITGNVYDEDNNPIEGVIVDVYDLNNNWVTGASTDANGFYAVRDVPEGNFKVKINPLGLNYVSEWYNDAGDFTSAAMVSVVSGQTTAGIDANLSQGAQISGTVTSDSGALLRSSWIELKNLAGESVTTTWTDAAGNYTLTGIPSGEYKLYASRPASQYYLVSKYYNDGEILSLESGQVLSLIDVVLPEYGVFNGFIYDYQGNALNSYSCKIYNSSGTLITSTQYSGTYNGYESSLLPPGQYKIYFSGPSGSLYAPEWYENKPDQVSADWITVTAGQTTSGINASLGLTSKISGQVVNDQGVGLYAAYVVIRDVQGNQVNEIYTNSHGSYSSGYLNPGEYVVEFKPPSNSIYAGEWYNNKRNIASADRVILPESGQGATGINAQLEVGGSIAGRVLNVQAQGINGALVTIYDLDNNVRAQKSTGADGTYQAQGNLPTGSYKVLVTPPAGSNYLASWYLGKNDFSSADQVDVILGQVSNINDIVLADGGRIMGRITDPQGNGISGAYVSAANTSQSAFSNADGYYTVNGLNTGTYNVQFSPPYDSDFLGEWYDDKQDASLADPVSIVAGQSVENIDAQLTVGGRISGLVTNAQGQGMEGVDVYLYSGENLLKQAYTDYIGAYEFRGVAEGDYQVLFYPNPEVFFEYTPIWHNNKIEQSSADRIHVTNGQTTSSIDVVLLSIYIKAGLVAAELGSDPSSIVVTAPFTDDSNENGTRLVEYRESSTSDWIAAATLTYSDASTTITGLTSGLSYDVRVTYDDPDGMVYGNKVQEIIGVQIPDVIPPTVTSVSPTGVVSTKVTIVTVDYADSLSGINPASASVTLNGNALSGCTTTETSVSCPVSGLTFGTHSIGGSVADNAGNTAPISGSFSVSALALGLTSRLSTDSAGVQGNGNSFYVPAALSADGNFTAFASLASNLVPGDTNGTSFPPTFDVFVKNNNTGQITRVSTDSAGGQANNTSDNSSISADGRYVAFRSYASNLVAGDTNNVFDVFLKDTQTGTTARVSTTATGAQASGDNGQPSISADGRYVAFRSIASNLVSGDTNSKWDIFVKDTQTGQVTRVSVDSAGVQANSDSETPSISADGRYVAFRSLASNLVSGDTNGTYDVFVKDTQSGAIIRISTDSAGVQANSYSGWPSISADGRYVAFNSNASNLVSGDTNSRRDVFVKDTLTAETRRYSVDSTGAQANNQSDYPAISADGRYLAFSSDASNLVSGDTNGRRDIFVKDTITAKTVRYSLNSVGGQTNNTSDYPAISAEGKHVVFSSSASNLVSGDANGTGDVFISSKSPPIITSVQPSGSINTDSTTISVSYVDGGSSGIDTSSVSVTLDGNTLSGCTVTQTGASCPVSGLSVGNHTIGGSVSDNEGSQSTISGSFTVIDASAPTIESVEPTGILSSTSLTINAAYSDPAPSSGINPASVNVTLDGNALFGCTATETNVSCPISGLTFGTHTIGGSVADNAGNTATISGSFNVSALIAGLTSRLSTDSAGTEGNGSSYYSVALSADGNFTAFTSAAFNLVPGDTNAVTDVFFKDNNTGQIIRISTDSAGAQANSSSSGPSISAEGRYVAFRSQASNLVSGDGNGKEDIFVKDTQTGITTRVSTTSSGAEANSSSDSNYISADGRYVAFRSLASNLVSGDTNNNYDVFKKDTQTGAIVRVSTTAIGSQGNSYSGQASMSTDGRYVAFYSNASNLVSSDTNGSMDIFVKDTQTGAIARVSTTSTGAEANGKSTWSSISADGRYVAFDSTASNLVSGDTNATYDIFVKDTETGLTTRVSTDSGGGQADALSFSPLISADGRYVAFISAASNLVAGDTNTYYDVFVKDTQTGAIVRVSTDTAGAQSNDKSEYLSISADGKYVAFSSMASNLVAGDTNGTGDVFIRSWLMP